MSDPSADANGSTATVGRLLAAVRGGDVAAIGDLLARFQPWLRLLARIEVDSRLGGRFDASDAVQQTLLEACRALPAFRGDTDRELMAFLRQILSHVLAREARRNFGTQKRDAAREVSLEAGVNRSSQRLAAMLADAGTSPSVRASQNEQELLLADALSRMPEDYREVIVLRHMMELSHEEVAARLGRSTGAVRMLWVRALAHLRRELDG